MPTRGSRLAGPLDVCRRSRALRSWCSMPVARTATSMFSSTVIRGNIRQSWKLRPMPARAIRCGALPVMSLARVRPAPESGLIMPVTQLKNVVLPEPLGPISALTLPCWKVTVAPSTAVTPPNDLVSPTVSRLRHLRCPAVGSSLHLRRSSAVTVPSDGLVGLLLRAAASGPGRGCSATSRGSRLAAGAEPVHQRSSAGITPSGMNSTTRPSSSPVATRWIWVSPYCALKYSSA